MVVTCRPQAHVLRLEAGGQGAWSDLYGIAGARVWLRVPLAPSPGQNVTLELSGPGRLTLAGVVRSVAAEAPDGCRCVVLDLVRVTSAESGQAVSDFVTRTLGLRGTPRPTRTGALFFVALGGDGELEEPLPAPEGAQVRVAGRKTSVESPPPFDTGLPPTTKVRLVEYFEKDARARVGVYLNVPCAYVVAGTQYWGRALRMNDRWLQINTNSAVPGLGVRLRCDLTLEVDGVRRAVSLTGVHGRKLDPPAGSTYKGAMGVRIGDVDEGDCPGLLVHYLRLHEARRAERDGA